MQLSLSNIYIYILVFQSSKSKVGLLSGVQRSESKSGVSLSGASDTSDPRPNVSRSKSKTGTKKEDTKEEFVVG